MKVAFRDFHFIPSLTVGVLLPQQFVVRKQFYKLVKSFFSAHKWILAPGSRGYGAARAMGLGRR